MNIFFSWSGINSEKAARAFKDWLPCVLQTAQPFFSPDTEKGSVWIRGLSQSLKTCSAGLIFLTPENLESPWILFEAGAISKQVGDARVCTVLIGLEHSQVRFPLAQFQHTKIEKDDIFKLVSDLNESLEKPVIESVLGKSFEALWPEFQQELIALEEGQETSVRNVTRSGSDLIEEVLKLTRETNARVAQIELALDGGMVVDEGHFRAALLDKESSFPSSFREMVDKLTDGNSRDPSP